MPDPDLPEFGDTFELCCGRKNGCPIIKKTPEGFELSDKGEVISMTDAQGAGLKDFIEAKLRAKSTG